MLRPVRTAAPEATPVTVAEIKANSRIDHSADDTMLAILLQAAVDHFDGWTGTLGRCIVTQGWRLDLGGWPSCRTIGLPFPDVTAVAVTYYDADNVEQTVSSSLYELLEDARGSFIRFRDGFTYPAVYSDRSDGVRVAFTAGFGNAAAVPAAIKQAIMLLAAHWYENREATIEGTTSIEIPFGVRALTRPYERVGF